MKLLKYHILFFTILVHQFSIAQHSIQGCFNANFAIAGWFGLQMEFYEDQTFSYLFAGDLFYDKASGTYDRRGKEIILSFKPMTDSIEISMPDSLGNMITSHFPAPENIASNHRPTRLLMKKDHLILYDENGQIVRRKYSHGNRRKRYYLTRGICE